MSEETKDSAADRAAEAIAAKHGVRVAESVMAILDELDLRIRVAPNLERRAARERDRMASDAQYKASHTARKHASTVQSQNATMSRAGRRTLPWTGPELEIAAREDLTAAQVAQMTGRTLYGVNVMRRKLRKDPRKIDLAGVRGPGEVSDS